MRVTRLAIASLGLMALSYFGGAAEAQDVKPPATLWTFLGFPPKHAVKDHMANRNGNHPGLERKPPRLAIADPKNLKSPVPAIKKAAEVKTQEDLAPQKIKAIKYLASIGCGCYNRDGSITDALLAALDDCTETVRLAAADAISATAGDVCENCNQQSCCTKEIHDRLMKMAYEMDKDGCWIEPSARVRGAAARALLACPPQEEIDIRGRELPPGERELPPGVEVIPPAPTPAPPAPMSGTRAVPTPTEPSFAPPADETGSEEAGRQETDPIEEVRNEQIRILKTNIDAPRRIEARKQEAEVEPKIDEARRQPKSSRRTAQLGLLQATPVATRRVPESQAPANIPVEDETIQRLPPIVDASTMVTVRPAPLIVNNGTVEFIDLKQRLVVVRTSGEGQLPVGATVQASHRFLTGPAVVGQLKVVASEPGSATLQPINGMQVSKVAQGDQITVSR
ncbi:MAG: hypothetical protein IAF94_19005 [Pirellulaceae bacterium]|nr:hypothetical protein [Pirellulaceae bacterium]